MADEAMDTKTWAGVVAVALSALGLLVKKANSAVKKEAANKEAAPRISELEDRIEQLEQNRERLDHDREFMETKMQRIEGETQSTLRLVNRMKTNNDERWNILTESLERVEQATHEALRMVRTKTGSGDVPSRMS